MKTFKQILSENNTINECWEQEDDMTLRELKIACHASRKILEMVENGAELERWNISKITLAADYLNSVYSFMQSSHETSQVDYYSDDEEYVGPIGYY
jgi:hypothetical protein